MKATLERLIKTNKIKLDTLNIAISNCEDEYKIETILACKRFVINFILELELLKKYS